MFRHTHHHNDNDNNPPYPPPGSNPHQPPPPPQPHPPVYGVPQPPPPHREPLPQVYHTSHQAPPPPPNPYGHPSPAPAPAPAPAPYLGSVQHVSHTNQSPSPNVRHVSHESHLPPNRADFASPVSATVHHVSHTNQSPSPNVRHVSHESHLPPNRVDFASPASATVHHVSHQSSGSAAAVSNKNIVKVVTKADPNYCLTIRGGKVILAYSDPSDEYQRWYKDLKYSTRVKDEEGYPAFSLVNKVTGEAIKHSVGATHPVQLIRYNPDVLDESVLWTESKDLGDGHRAIRMVNNIRLNVDAYHGDKRSGGVHDGTTVVLWEWNNGDNQHWKIVSN